MTYAYDKAYLNNAMINLGNMFECACLDLNFDPDCFFKMFIDSSIAHKFSIGNPDIVCGHSGCELVEMVIYETDHYYPNIEYGRHEYKGKYYWVGEVLAYYQWLSGQSFKMIYDDISVRKILKMYDTYHEMDIDKIADTLYELQVKSNNYSISELRRRKGLSQKVLAKEAEMSVSQLQRLEHQERKVENISLKTASSLAKALGIYIEELI